MLKQRKLSSGTEFITATIPAGTALFRGIYGEQPGGLFADFIGKYNKTTDAYEISPTDMVFFYPAPYASDSVNFYPIKAIYLTNYNIELVLLVLPSNISKGTNTDVLSISSEKDICGKNIDNENPCLTDRVRYEFPSIKGYIALAVNDVGYLKQQFKSFIKKKKTYGNNLLSFLISNSAERQGIAEIAIHPLNNYESYCRKIHTSNFRGGDANKEFWLKRKRHEFSFIPFCYINETNLYYFKNINVKLLEKSERHQMDSTSKIYNIETELINMLLDKDGLKINNKTYYFTIDKRTGFYIIKQDIKKNNKTHKNKNTFIHMLEYNNDKDDKEYEIPVEYSITMKKEIQQKMFKNTIFMKSQLGQLDSFTETANINGYTAIPKYIFNRGNGERLLKSFVLMKPFEI